jgi:very-short-patch-repair endonuclease
MTNAEKHHLVIEVDGGGHALPNQIVVDERRSDDLRSRGYRVLRFWNNEIFENIEGVVSVISSALKRAQTPHP